MVLSNPLSWLKQVILVLALYAWDEGKWERSSIFMDVCGMRKKKKSGNLCSVIMRNTEKVLKCHKESDIRMEEQ